MKNLIVSIFIIWGAMAMHVHAEKAVWPAKTHYKYQEVNGHTMFYREAGEQSSGKPTILLLHGWPSSSHYFRELIPLLSGRFHVIAPDNLGSGYSDKPDATKLTYTFDLLADQVDGLLKSLEIDEFVIFVQDFGAPVGFRTMLRGPERVKGIIAQNGNAYMEGLGEGVANFFKEQAAAKSPDFAEKMGTYPHDVVFNVYKDNVRTQPDIQSPDAYHHDWLFIDSKEEQLIQAQLAQDYVNNLKDYPMWQEAFRRYQPRTIAIWGERDTFFIGAGGKAFKKDISNAEYVGLDAGHFAVEEKPVEIAQHIIEFMNGFKPSETKD